MIIAITGQCGTWCKAIGEGLALLRARSGRKVLLVDAESWQEAVAANRRDMIADSRARVRRCVVTGHSPAAELARLSSLYQDIVIDTDGHDTSGRARLIAANLVIVPIEPSQAVPDRYYALIARLNVARMFNPGLHIMFVIAAGPANPSGVELAQIGVYVAQVTGATLCPTVIHEPGDIAALYHDAYSI